MAVGTGRQVADCAEIIIQGTFGRPRAARL